MAENFDVKVPKVTLDWGENKYLLVFDLFGFLKLEESGDSIEQVLCELEKKPLSKTIDLIMAFACSTHPNISKEELTKGISLACMRSAAEEIMRVLPEAMRQLNEDEKPEFSGTITNAGDTQAQKNIAGLADKIDAEKK